MIDGLLKSLSLRKLRAQSEAKFAELESSLAHPLQTYRVFSYRHPGKIWAEETYADIKRQIFQPYEVHGRNSPTLLGFQSRVVEGRPLSDDEAAAFRKSHELQVGSIERAKLNDLAEQLIDEERAIYFYLFSHYETPMQFDWHAIPRQEAYITRPDPIWEKIERARRVRRERAKGAKWWQFWKIDNFE